MLRAAQVSEVEPNFAADDSLVAACRSLLGEQSSFIDSATMAQELLLGGWIQQHYKRLRSLPSEI